ncbi:uncharacterized protein LOC114338247 [Diabrotica virgifera virgifera]|uniref:Uncharacterized protein LOC114338247 n=1 Tax=Diabrotica virgifera virgifera TaxID=50390 RepID=A0A6P7G6G5_DIAVI|nr:uncharacterized protein LOC114338247 [Diabrotica virgifera virgifera]
MKCLCIFVVAIAVLGVSCLPSRQRRQFDWAEWETNANQVRNRNINRNIRQSWNQQGGRQIPTNSWNPNGPDFSDPDFNQDPNVNIQIPSIQIPNNQLPVDNGVTPDGSTTTTASPAYTRCFANCRTTSEYNPVCGTDGNNYDNPQRLNCARSCGRNVQLRRGGTCQPL